jgi:hypothetical protein
VRDSTDEPRQVSPAGPPQAELCPSTGGQRPDLEEPPLTGFYLAMFFLPLAILLGALLASGLIRRPGGR